MEIVDLRMTKDIAADSLGKLTIEEIIEMAVSSGLGIVEFVKRSFSNDRENLLQKINEA